MRPYLGAFIAVVTVVAANIASAEKCTQLLSNVYDFRSTTSSNTRAASFRNWYCSHEFESIGDSQQTGINLGVPLEGVPVEFGFDDSREEFSTWESRFCSDTSSQDFNSVYLSKIEKTINPAVINAFNECTRRGGLHFWLMSTGTIDRYVLAGRLTPISDGQIAAIRSFETENLDCNNVPSTIGVAEFQTICRRLTMGSGDIVVTADITTHNGHLIVPAAREVSEFAPVHDRPWGAMFRFKANNHCATKGTLEEVTSNGDVLIGLGGTTVGPATDDREAHLVIKTKNGNEFQQFRVAIVTPRLSQIVILPGGRRFEINVRKVEECSTEFKIRKLK